jgi:hypothetical protein
MDEKNWYKLTTLVLSIITVILSVITGVYYHYGDAKDKGVSNLNSKIEALQKRKIELLEIPKLNVEVFSLKESKLPGRAFEKLQEIPSMVKLSHAGGSSAKEITLSIKSSEPIISYQANDIPEPLKINKKSDFLLEANVDRLRKDVSLEIVLYTKHLTNIEYHLITDYGVRILDKARTTNLYSDLMNWETLSPQNYDQIDDIDFLTTYLNRELVDIRSKPIVDTSIIIIVISIGYFVLFPLWFVYRRIRDFKMSRRIIHSYERDLLKADMETNDLLRLLGKPRHRFTPTKGKNPNLERWEYDPPGLWRAYPDLFLILEGGKLREYYYHFFN